MSTRKGIGGSTWLWSSLGVLLLGLWVAGCGFAFLALLRLVPDGMTAATIGLLSWQFVIVLIAIPVLALTMVGGLKMINHAVTIRDLLRELPQQVQTFDELAKVAARSGEHIEKSKAAMTEAAGTLDQAMSQLADFESRFAQLRGVSETPADAQITQQELVDELNRHLNRAKELFDNAAKDHEERTGLAVERARGWILDSSVADLRKAGALKPMVAAYIDLALDVDRKTRRSGRSNLEAAHIQALDALEPADKAKK